MAQDITLRVITPDRIVLDTTASAVQIPGLDGLIGILPRHAPMVAALDAGALMFEKGGGKEGMFVAGGFAEVRDNTVRVVSPASEPPGQIDEGRAERAAERARRRLHARQAEDGARETAAERTDTFDAVRAEASLRRALMRIYVKNKFTY